MRSILAGLLILLLTAVASAQTKGEVESIGFGGYIRPDCWTPMVIRLRPGTLEPGYYQIQVEQKDLDEDTQVFTRMIQVNAADQAKEQRFWMYFLPQPLNGGLPDNSVKELNAEMKVWLCTDKGKQIEPLPMTSTVRSIDASNGRTMGRKFILCVTDGSSKPIFQDYNVAFGEAEDMAMIVVRPEELPESVLGYDGIDAIVWMSGDGDLLSRAGARRLPAITEYVRLGGRLIVTQPAERQKVEALESLLPIQLKDAAGNWTMEIQDRTTLDPLSDWASPKPPPGFRNPWLSPKGTFKVARIKGVKPGARVSETIDWVGSGKTEKSPYLVRWGVGLGEVAWVAQGLGDLSITAQIQTGWMGIWDKVLDLKSEPALKTVNASASNVFIDNNYPNGHMVDLGYSLISAVEHNARGAWLVIVAIVFFIVYWVLSGPVSYLVLAGKKKKGMSWQIFAVSALVATLLTVGVVKLVLGASADIHHITFVRLTPGQPAVVESRVGVYLTKSSNIPITLTKSDPNYISYVSAFNPHPALYDNPGGFVGKEKYSISVPESGTSEAIEISVPFRSTLKKIQARWVGQLGGVDGIPKLTEASEQDPMRLSGKLTNSTGRDLADIYFAFSTLKPNGEWEDRVYYFPKWAKEAQIDLDKDLTASKAAEPLREEGFLKGARPGEGKVVSGIIPIAKNDGGWSKYWIDPLRNNSNSATIEGGADARYIRSFPMTSLYDRLPAVKRFKDGGPRFDLQRRGGRRFNMSQGVSAGELVILAQDAANNVDGKTLSKLPYPLEVDRDAIEGTGVTFYQIALPLTRETPPPATMPVEK